MEDEALERVPILKRISIKKHQAWRIKNKSLTLSRKIKIMNSYRWLITGLFLCAAFAGQAQFNLKVGYNLGIMNAKVQNGIYEAYNLERPWLDKPFTKLKALNGLQLGLRYKFFNRIALEGGIQTQFHRKTTNGKDPISEKTIRQTPSFAYSSFGLGVETFILQSFSWGVTLNYDRLNISNNTQDVNKFTVSTEDGWSSHVFLSLNIPGNSHLSMSIRPYAQIPWTSFDLQPLKNSILSTSETEQRLEQGYMAFGLMILFYNGRSY